MEWHGHWEGGCWTLSRAKPGLVLSTMTANSQSTHPRQAFTYGTTGDEVMAKILMLIWRVWNVRNGVLLSRRHYLDNLPDNKGMLPSIECGEVGIAILIRKVRPGQPAHRKVLVGSVEHVAMTA